MYPFWVPDHGVDVEELEEVEEEAGDVAEQEHGHDHDQHQGQVQLAVQVLPPKPGGRLKIYRIFPSFNHFLVSSFWCHNFSCSLTSFSNFSLFCYNFTCLFFISKFCINLQLTLIW